MLEVVAQVAESKATTTAIRKDLAAVQGLVVWVAGLTPAQKAQEALAARTEPRHIRKRRWSYWSDRQH